MSEKLNISKIMIGFAAWVMPVLLFSGQAVIILYILSCSRAIMTFFAKCLMPSDIKEIAIINEVSQLDNPKELQLLTSRAKIPFKNPAFFLPFSLIIFGSLSVFWSVAPDRTGDFSLLLLVFLGLYFLSLNTIKNSAEPFEKPKLFLPICLSAIYMIIDHTSNYSVSLFLREIFGFSTENIRQPQDKGSAVFVLLMPLFWMVMRPKSWQRVLLIGLLLGAFITHPMQSAQLAVLVGFIAWILHKILGIKAVFIFVYTAIFLLLSAPWFFGFIANPDAIRELVPAMPESWMQRVEMWQVTSDLILEEPILGYGMASSRVVSDVIQLHPHNNFLQIWLELGAIGAFISAGILAVITKLIAGVRGVRRQRAILMTISSWLVFSQMSFGLWQEWWVCTCLLVLVIAMCAVKDVAK